MKRKYNYIHRLNHLINKADRVFVTEYVHCSENRTKCSTDVHTQCSIEVKNS